MLSVESPKQEGEQSVLTGERSLLSVKAGALSFGDGGHSIVVGRVRSVDTVRETNARSRSKIREKGKPICRGLTFRDVTVLTAGL